MKYIFQSFHANDLGLDRHRIDIWQYPLHTEFKDALSVLSKDEIDRANRYYFPHHRKRFIVARAMLRLILARYLNTSASQLNFSENRYGKPFLQNYPSLTFNLSHSADLALLAVGTEFHLGIDLEFFSARSYRDLGKHIFSEQENYNLSKIHPRLQPLAFFHMWAQKESFIKACGLGLSYPTQSFDVPLLPSTNTSIIDEIHQQVWQIISFMPQINCCAALCHHPEINTIRWKLESGWEDGVRA